MGSGGGIPGDKGRGQVQARVEVVNYVSKRCVASAANGENRAIECTVGGARSEGIWSRCLCWQKLRIRLRGGVVQEGAVVKSSRWRGDRKHYTKGGIEEY